jgi:signal peptidase I
MDEDATASDPNYTPRPVSKKPLGCLIEIAETLILTIVIFWLIQTFVAQPFRVQQQSMHGTLEENQYVLVDKLTPKFDPYNRGDIVVLNPIIHDEGCSAPGSPYEPLGDVPFIKRVIGEPGDLIELRGGSVYVNGVAISEPYIRGARTTPENGETSWHLPADQVFVMGDNRENSSDSREFGPICIQDLVGRAWLRYWPLDTVSVLQTPTYPNVPAAQGPASATPKP